MANADNNDSRETAAKTTNFKAMQRKSRRGRLALLCFIMLVAAVILAPTIVAKTPLFAWILKKSTSDLKGSVAVDSISLGWLSPIELKGIEVKDTSGKSVFATPSITGNRTLLAIACNYTKLGSFRIDNPKLAVVMKNRGGTNVEDLLANYLNGTSSSSSSSKYGAAVEVVGGSISVVDERLGQRWEVGRLGMKFDMSEGADGPILAEASAEMPVAQGASKLSMSLKMTTTTNEVAVDLQQFPLALMRPFWNRYVVTQELPATAVVGATGQLNVKARLCQSSSSTSGALAVSLADFTLWDAQGKSLFREPSSQLVIEGDYNPKTQNIQLAKCEINSGIFAAKTTGNIATINGKNQAALEAQIRYDLDGLCNLLRPCTDYDLHWSGQGAAGLRFAGPFTLTEGSAAARVQWNGGEVYGFNLHQTEVQGSLLAGVLQTTPIDAAIGTGKIHLAPKILLTSSPKELRLPAGRIVDHVPLNGALCDSMLQYVAPATAGVSSVQGSFSVDLDDECRIPLGKDALKKSVISGRVVFHSLALGSSPLLHEMATFQTRESGAQCRNETVVAFQLKDGVVSHKGLELSFPEITIRTHGSVNLENKKIDLVIEMPPPSVWLKDPMVARTIGNQTISIPIRGTLTSPQLDQTVLKEAMNQFGHKAVSNMVESGINLLVPRR
jgi:hypothetical protein